VFTRIQQQQNLLAKRRPADPQHLPAMTDRLIPALTAANHGRFPARAPDPDGCRIGLPPFVEKVEGGRRRHPGKGGDMTEYLIAFNDEWVPDHHQFIVS
jgi:hypothetical protein